MRNWKKIKRGMWLGLRVCRGEDGGGGPGAGRKTEGFRVNSLAASAAGRFWN